MGLVQLWVNGDPQPRKGAAMGCMLMADPVVILGQDKDSYRGSLKARQALWGR